MDCSTVGRVGLRILPIVWERRVTWTGSLLAASRYLVAAVFCQCRVLCFTAGLRAGYPFCSVCGVVSFVFGIRVLGLGPFPF